MLCQIDYKMNITELEIFFAEHYEVFVNESEIKLSECETIINPTTFIGSELECLKSNCRYIVERSIYRLNKLVEIYYNS
jgi:hypothetical protein